MAAEEEPQTPVGDSSLALCPPRSEPRDTLKLLPSTQEKDEAMVSHVSWPQIYLHSLQIFSSGTALLLFPQTHNKVIALCGRICILRLDLTLSLVPLNSLLLISASPSCRALPYMPSACFWSRMRT